MQNNQAKTVLQVCATNSTRLSDLGIKDGQLIFIQDKCRIAFDLEGRRRFYNEIELIQTDDERKKYQEAENGLFYFVVDTATLWAYQDDWVQLTTAPEEIVFIGVSFPELGSAKTLYVNREKKEISVWDEAANEYVVVANETDIGSISESEIDLLFV